MRAVAISADHRSEDRMTMGWTREQAKQLADQILSYSRARDCDVRLDLVQRTHTRFAANEVTTSGAMVDLNISVSSRDGKRTGTLQVNETSREALKKAVARSEQLMHSAAPDAEYMEDLGPQQYPEVHAFNEETASATALDRRAGIQQAMEISRARKLKCSAFVQTTSRWSAIANKRKNFGFFASTQATFTSTARTQDATGSGWAGGASPRLLDISTQSIVERAAKKAESSANPRALDPGKYTVVLEPQAVADLMPNLLFSFSRRIADQGKSFLSKPGGGNRLGEKLFPDFVTIRSDPFNAQWPARPWAGGGGAGMGGARGGFLGFGGFGGAAFEGLPVRKVTWIDRGVVNGLSVDRYWATRVKVEPLPFSGTITMEGGSGKIEDLIAGTERGLLITHFWYIRPVNPQNVELTGLTRDGVWLIEKGKIAYPVNNFRFNQSPVNMLKNIEAMSEPVVTALKDFSSSPMVVPAIRAKDFLFSSKSDAV